MENKAHGDQQKARRSNALVILFWIAGLALIAFGVWRLYLTFQFVKFIFEIILLPIRIIGELLNRNGP